MHTMPDIESMARAMFERFHGMVHRPRNWDLHPDEDAGVEAGRNTFRAMADAVKGLEPAPLDPHLVELAHGPDPDPAYAHLVVDPAPANDATPPVV